MKNTGIPFSGILALNGFTNKLCSKPVFVYSDSNNREKGKQVVRFPEDKMSLNYFFEYQKSLSTVYIGA
jgi:hypothetical protein